MKSKFANFKFYQKIVFQIMFIVQNAQKCQRLFAKY